MWQNLIWIVFLCGRLWSEQYHVHLVSVLSEFCVVHSWQNGTRCGDGVNMHVVVSFSSCLAGFLRVPSLCALVLIRKTFCDLFLLLFFWK